MTSVRVLLGTGAVDTLASVAVLRVSDRRANDPGVLDETTGSRPPTIKEA
jgi:hypothetical protein